MAIAADRNSDLFIDGTLVLSLIHDSVFAPVLVLVTRTHDATRVAMISNFVSNLRMQQRGKRHLSGKQGVSFLQLRISRAYASIMKQMALTIAIRSRNADWNDFAGCRCRHLGSRGLFATIVNKSVIIQVISKNRDLSRVDKHVR